MASSTYGEIRRMVKNGINKGYSHVIIVCDTFDYEDYPVYVKKDEDIHSIISKYNKNMQKIMEIYNYDMDIEKQLNENRAYHIETINKTKSSSNKINTSVQNQKSRKEILEKYPELMTKSEEALEFAAKKHEGQFRKGFDHKPYIEHPIMVAGLIEKYKGNSHEIDSLKAAGYLHDTIEDTDTTFEELAKKFGIQIASLVMELTNIDEFKDEMGKEKYQAIKMAHMSNWAYNIKLCDILANLHDLYAVSDKEKKKFIEQKTYSIYYSISKRNLTKTQKNIIEDIINIIRIILTNQFPEETDTSNFKLLLKNFEEKK